MPSFLLERIGESWRTSLRDMVLIVVSILIAFGLDAWWEGQQDRAREQRHLEALLEEFQVYRHQLLDDLTDVEKADSAAQVVLEAMADASSSLEDDALARLFNEMFDIDVRPREGGALAALVSSGDVGLLQDEDLARLLLEWPMYIQELRANGEILVFNREEEIRPRLKELGMAEARIAANLSDLGLPESRFRFAAEAILNDVSMESALVSRRVRLLNLHRNVNRAVTQVEEILERLGQQLEGE